MTAASVAYAATDGKKLSQAECDTLWMQANPSKAEKIPESAASAYITDMKSVNPDGDGTIEQDEFNKACSDGMIKSMAAAGTEKTGRETSDRTPEKKTETPLPQKDTVEGETSDRTPEK
jgi:hypothetical protein